MPEVPKAGDRVRYHGSKVYCHGEYVIAVVPYNPDGRGYVLAPVDDNDDNGVISWVHRESFTRLEDESEEGDDAMPTRAQLLSLGYDEEYLDSIPDFVPDLLEAIEDGVFDSYIKQIAAACFDRKDVLGGKPAVRAAMLASARNATVKSAHDGPVLGENGYMLSPVDYTAKTLLVGGKRYSKTDMEGRHLRLVGGAGRDLPWYWDGVLVKIVGVGNQFVVVATSENPQERHPTSTELKKKSIESGYRLRIDPDFIRHIFG